MSCEHPESLYKLTRRHPVIRITLPVGLLLASLAASMSVSVGVLAEDTAPGNVQVTALSIEQALTDTPGNAEQGREVFSDRKLGNCLACHANSDMSDMLFHGEVGPALDGVASRWKPEQLRTIVVNSKLVFTERTVMPAFYSLDVGENVREDLLGETILTAQQVEDLVAYLVTLN